MEEIVWLIPVSRVVLVRIMSLVEGILQGEAMSIDRVSEEAILDIVTTLIKTDFVEVVFVPVSILQIFSWDVNGILLEGFFQISKIKGNFMLIKKSTSTVMKRWTKAIII